MGNVVRYRSRRALIQRLALFSPPRLLEGEDAAAYDDLLARICAAVQPDDIIGELLVGDVVSSQWEAWRWHRLKFVFLRERSRNKIKEYLLNECHYQTSTEEFEQALAETLQDLVEGQTEKSAQDTAHRYVLKEPDAIKRIDELLDAAGIDLDSILDPLKTQKMTKLFNDYVRREPDAIEQVNELLADGRTMDDFVVDGLFEELSGTVDCLTAIERIDRLITVAENRRDAGLREIHRHRAALAEALRNKLRETEAAEFQEIESLTRGKRSNAA